MENESTFNSKLGQFFMNSLNELYWAESNLVTVLTTMSDVSTSTELKEAFESHRDQTVEHVRRLETIFEMLGTIQESRACAGLQGLFNEGWQIIDETETYSYQRDVALIIAAQKVEHYEIAAYGSLVTLAQTLRRKDIAKELKKTLEEEKETDALLTQVAEANINKEASEEPATITH